MAKSSRPTTKDAVLFKKGQIYAENELNDIASKMVGGVRESYDVNSIKDVVSYLNNNLISLNAAISVSDRRGELGKRYTVFAHDVNKSDLFSVRYNKSLGGYILSESKNISSDAAYQDVIDSLSYSGYSVQSVTKNGVTYDNVIVKRNKNVWPARYEIAKK